MVDVLEQEKDFLIKDEGESLEEIKSAIIKITMKDPEIGVRDIADVLTTDYGFKTSKSAVDRMMHDNDYKKEGPVGPNGKKTWMMGTIQLLGLNSKSEEAKREALKASEGQKELSF